MFPGRSGVFLRSPENLVPPTPITAPGSLRLGDQNIATVVGKCWAGKLPHKFWGGNIIGGVGDRMV